MKGLLAAAGFALLSALCPGSPALAQTGTEQEKMESMKKMFTSKYSEEMVHRTDRLLLTATGSLLPIHKAPAVASIITAEDIARLGASSLDEVLETVPGLHITPSPLSRMNPVYSIRGIHTGINPQVLFMLNGIPVRSVFSGGKVNSFRLPVANISRVEVIRGPGSAVHGADAFAGTVNVITKDGMEIDGSEFGARAGSAGSASGWALHGGTYQGWDLSLGMEYQKSDGDRDRVIDSDYQTFLDSLSPGPAISLAPGSLDTSFATTSAHLGLARDSWTFRFWGWLQNNAGMGDGATNVLAPRNSFDGSYFIGDANYLKKDLLTKDLDLNLRWSYSLGKDDSFLQLFPPGFVLPVTTDPAMPPTLFLFEEGLLANPSGTEKTYAFDTTLFYSGAVGHRLRLGAGISRVGLSIEESKNFGHPGIFALPVDPITGMVLVDGALTDVTGTPFAFIKNQNRTVWHLSLQDEWTLARNWEFTAGVRYDHYSDFGATINPRLALVWEARYDLTAKLLYGRAFRPPSFSEQFLQNNPAAQGNSSLRPETIQTVELVLDYQPAPSLRSILNLFAYDIEEMIDYELDNPADANSPRTAQNSKDQRGYGLELETEWRPLPTVRLQANLAYQQSEDRKSKNAIPDAPQLQFHANGQWEFLPDWHLSPQFYWIGKRSRAEGDTRPEIDDYALVHLALKRTNILHNWDATLSVNNLFDADARAPSSARSFIINDYPLEGRSVFFALRCRF